MPDSRPVEITLADEKRKALEKVVKRHSTPQQIVERAKIILLADEGKSNSQISREFTLSLDMVRLWRRRKLLRRGSFTSLEQLQQQVLAFITYYNDTMAKPFKWTFQGKPLTL